jgi:hypothetical protein
MTVSDHANFLENSSSTDFDGAASFGFIRA